MADDPRHQMTRRKRLRRVQAKPGQLLAQWGRDDGDDVGVVYAAGGGGVGTSDAGMLSTAFNYVKGLHGTTLVKELEARGFDLTTLRFSIERKVHVT